MGAQTSQLVQLSFRFWFMILALLNASHTIFAQQQDERIDEEKFISINGIEQWVTIKGNLSKPAILFLHGGPGSPLTPYADNLYKYFEKEFILVQWDQRGTGKTFGQTAPEELTLEYLKANPLTIQQMSNDGIQLAEYLIGYLKKKKIILFGTSWGSVLGVQMASQRPDLFHAYVGHSQIVSSNDYVSLYNKVRGIAERQNDQEALQILNTIGKPPYDKARNTGHLFRIVKKYERENSVPAPGSWFILSPRYDNAKDNQNRSDGDDYSFVNYVGDKGMAIEPMNAKINFLKENLVFRIPIHIIQGEEDILTPKEETQKYFDQIQAPAKQFYLLPKTAHGFNQSVLEMQYKVFKSLAGL